MKANRSMILGAAMLALALTTLACGLPGGANDGTGGTSNISGAVAPMTIGGDLTAIDVCAAVPKEMFEQALGRSPVTAEKFSYYDTSGTSGCQYTAPKDSNSNAYYGYVALTPENVYDEQPLVQNTPVSGIGDEAYFNNGADVRQLWVRIKGKVAFVVGLGDVPREDALKAIGKLVAGAIR